MVTVIALLSVIGGCSSGTQHVATTPPAAAAPTITDAVMSSGMAMSLSTAGPSKPAAMICSEEVRGDLRTILGAKQLPAGAPSWRYPVYTCSYRLGMGTLTLAVHESADETTAAATVRRLRRDLGGGPSVLGLGPDGYTPADGVVLLRKDNDVLVVDARGLPTVFGSNDQHRADFAFEVATTILGCWTGDDD